MSRLCKSVLTAVVLAVSCIPAFSRDVWRQYRRNYESLQLNVGLSTYSISTEGYFTRGGYYWCDNWRGPDSTLGEIYADYTGATYTSGSLNMELSYRTGRWFAFSMDLSAGLMWHEVFDGVSDASKGNRYGVSLMLIPRVKLYYTDWSVVNLYGSAGLGLAAYCGFDKLPKSDKIGPALQVTPIGVGITPRKTRFSFFFEVGFGNMYSGYNAGVGYRF